MIKRFRANVKRSKSGSLIWRVAVGVIGGLVTVLGAIALVAPGPGWLIIFAGLGILASEFAWADKALIKTKMLAIKTAQRALPADIRKSVIYLIGAVVVIAIAIGAGVSYYLFAR
ncbi:unannotated protein [freshwater metagenome]|uniref:Unannotated protein n=1 Tax=freshwater metagenome TaxID=449393 RepID=A0A6J7UCC1_9ZZZZ|nr:hypothetical protein [Actinomycetota bacterium]